jgi:hypothetical protein
MNELNIATILTPKLDVFGGKGELFRLLPNAITNPLKNRKVTNRIARKILGRI